MTEYTLKFTLRGPNSVHRGMLGVRLDKHKPTPLAFANAFAGSVWEFVEGCISEDQQKEEAGRLARSTGLGF